MPNDGRRGKGGSKSGTTSKTVLGDNVYYGRNGHGKQNDVTSVFTVNPQTATHAEGDVFYQAKMAGDTNTTAILITDTSIIRTEPSREKSMDCSRRNMPMTQIGTLPDLRFSAAAAFWQITATPMTGTETVWKSSSFPARQGMCMTP